MYTLLILFSFITLSVSSKIYIPANCTLKSSCLCQDEYNNFVDLRPLAFNNGSARFIDVPTPGSDDGLYSWNPCFGFTEENKENKKNKNCSDVAVCKTTSERKSFINLGIQKTAFFSHFDNGNLSLNFYSNENDPNAVQTIISLYCDLDIEAAFRCPGYMEQNVYWLQLRSKYACPTKESDLIYPVNFGSVVLKSYQNKNEDLEKMSSFLPTSYMTSDEDSQETDFVETISVTKNIQHKFELFKSVEHSIPETSSTPPVPEISSTTFIPQTTHAKIYKLKPIIIPSLSTAAFTPQVPHAATNTLEPHVKSTPELEVSTPPGPHVVTMTSKPDVPINTISFLLICILMVVTLILGVLVAGATYRITKRKTPVAYRRLSKEKPSII